MARKKNTAVESSSDENVTLLIKAASSVSPVNELNNVNRAALCKTAQILHVQRNDQVQPEASNRWLMFLVEGSLQLFNGKEEVGTIAAKTNEALQPLFLDKAAYTSAKTTSVAKVVKFGREQLNILLNEQQKNAIFVVDTLINPHDNILFDDIVETMNANAMRLAIHGDSARRILVNIMKIKGTPELVELILTDPGLTAQILRITNRADSGGKETAQSLRGAVSRIGIDTAKSHTIELLKSSTIVPANATIEKRIKRYNQRTTLCCAIVQVLAASLPDLKPEQAALVAMTADIGELLVLTHANNVADKFTDETVLLTSIENLRTVLNGWVLATWEFPREYIEASYTARDWYRNHTGEITYTDLVTAALLIIQATMPESEHSSIPAVDNLLLARRLQQAGIDLKSPGSIMKAATAKVVNTNKSFKAG